MTSNPENGTMQSAARTFFSASHYAVAGASTNPSKFGYKIFVWYLDRNLSTTPMNPTAAALTVDGKPYPSIRGLENLPSEPSQTSLSIVTPPAFTLDLLREAKERGIKAVWLQPGTFGDAEMEFALKNFPGAAIGGFEQGTVGGEGWCVLVDGDEAIRGVGRQERL